MTVIPCGRCWLLVSVTPDRDLAVGRGFDRDGHRGDTVTVIVVAAFLTVNVTVIVMITV